MALVLTAQILSLDRCRWDLSFDGCWGVELIILMMKKMRIGRTTIRYHMSHCTRFLRKQLVVVVVVVARAVHDLFCNDGCWRVFCNDRTRNVCCLTGK